MIKSLSVLSAERKRVLGGESAKALVDIENVLIHYVREWANKKTPARDAILKAIVSRHKAVFEKARR